MRAVLDEQVEPALTMRPDLVSVYAGGNDLMRPSVDIDAIAGHEAFAQCGPLHPRIRRPDGTAPGTEGVRRGLELEQVADGGNRALVDEIGIGQIVGVVARAHGGVQGVDHVRIEGVILLAVDELEQTALVQRLAGLPGILGEQALSIGPDLLADQTAPVVVHGDLHYANVMAVQTIENYGQVKVTHGGDARPWRHDVGRVVLGEPQGPVQQGSKVQLGTYVIPDAAVWAFQAKEGETSPVIEGERGLYVFRLDSLHDAGGNYTRLDLGAGIDPDHLYPQAVRHLRPCRRRQGHVLPVPHQFQIHDLLPGCPAIDLHPLHPERKA